MAQWLAQGTHNSLVAGSNPAGPTIQYFGTLNTSLQFMIVDLRLTHPYKKLDEFFIYNDTVGTQ